MNEEIKNYYQILEVSTNCGPDEIQQGYIRAKNAYALDGQALYSLLSADECHQMQELIEEAFSILNDPEKRRQYDEIRGIKNRYQSKNGQKPQNPFHKDGHKVEANTTSTKISKLVANKKFFLEYEKNLEFESEIEKTTEFTGALLKKIREYKNVDLARLADMTKVSKTYLQKIENEDTTNLPALVYVRGFVFQYAKCLKLNPELVANSYLYRLKLNGQAS